LALLLTTSGSTGSGNMVRLTARNVYANAASIHQYLSTGAGERAVLSLPLHYSYGLSLVNSHLYAGGSLVFTRHSFMRPEFWSTCKGAEVTAFAGVPYMYEVLHRLRFDPGNYPLLRTMTQAGGALQPKLITHFHQLCRAGEKRLLVMYGQTEATARIAYVPPERLGEKIGSIGIAIPDGELTLRPVPDLPGKFELVYQGPNVMLGYANNPADLGRGDEMNSVLPTGDLARRDGDGFYFIEGRLKRFAKLFGRRVNLMDVESSVELRFFVRAAAVEWKGGLVLFLEKNGWLAAEVRTHLATLLQVPLTAIELRTLDHLPQTSSGKKNYRSLESELAS
jgi:acyl-CoA synthetase (AMP-forming)/AMP-acid ligase II